VKGSWKQGWQTVIILLATAVFGFADTSTMPPPGTLNYVEGQVLLNGRSQSPKLTGSRLLEAGQDLTTHNGNAELLLTPGVYLRVGHNSTVKMISPGLADTELSLVKGSALIEVDELFKENYLDLMVDGATTQIEKHGLYDFNADPASVSVLDGKARVSEDDQQVSLKKGREVLLAQGLPLRAKKFDRSAFESDPLYRWSMLRSEYASEANIETANNLLTYGGWYGPGWYWDPFWSFWSFLPGDGILWGPFGWGFYSPGWVTWAPYYGYPTWHHHFPVLPGRRGRPLMSRGQFRGLGARGFRSASPARSFPRMGAGGMRMGGGFAGGFGHRR
jgi:hypothetical protein